MKPSGDTELLWTIFKSNILKSVEKNVPSVHRKNKYSLPWINYKLRRNLKKKARLYKHAKKHNSWSKYKQFQKECKKQFRSAEWNHVNNIIQEGFKENTSKPFWKYVKSKKQDNIGIAPLKQKGNLITDAKAKANILVEQFQSVFTKTCDTSKPYVKTPSNLQDIPHLNVTQNECINFCQI